MLSFNRLQILFFSTVQTIFRIYTELIENTSIFNQSCVQRNFIPSFRKCQALEIFPARLTYYDHFSLWPRNDVRRSTIALQICEASSIIDLFYLLLHFILFLFYLFHFTLRCWLINPLYIVFLTYCYYSTFVDIFYLLFHSTLYRWHIARIVALYVSLLTYFISYNIVNTFYLLLYSILYIVLLICSTY